MMSEKKFSENFFSEIKDVGQRNERENI